MKFESAYLRVCLPLLLVIVANLVPHQSMQPEANAGPVTLRWDYTASGAAGFTLYCGASSHVYSTRVDVGNVDTYTIGTLPEGMTSFCAVTAYDSAKSESTFSNEVGVLVPYAPPNVSFSASTSTGVAPLSVVFSNTTSGQVTTWAWDFGDGTSANIKAPTHIYSAPGNYVVALSATGPGGTARKIASTPIIVSAIPAPVANFVASRTSGVAPLAVTFANTSTGQVTTWGWSFGDGSISSLSAPAHTYAAAGNYQVALTATGPGGTATKTAVISVSAPAPADAIPPTVGITTPLSGATVSGTTSVAVSASDNIGVTGVQLLIDGAALGAEKTAPPFSISWNTMTVANGKHTLSARARDAAGNLGSATAISVTVSNSTKAGLVAAYNFNAGSGTTILDASGTNNKGTFGTGVTWTTQGKFGAGLLFDGTSGKVTIPDSASLRLSTAMTLEAWVKPSTVDGKWRDVIYKGNDNYYLSASSTNGGKPAGRAGLNKLYGPATLPINAWTHIATTYDGTTLRFYVNGGQVSSAGVSGGITTSANPLQIGGDAIYGQYFRGVIDEVRIYSRALSPLEIQTDMNTPIAP
jgi:PKD repeat protein